MRTLPLLLCTLLALGCTKSPNSNPALTSQFAEASLSFYPPADPARPQDRSGRLSCTVGLIPAYKYQDSAQLVLWVFPRSSGPGLTMESDLSNPSLQGHQAQIINQSFSGEGVLLHFEAIWPGGPSDQIVGLDVMRKGRRIVRIFGVVQGQ